MPSSRLLVTRTEWQLETHAWERCCFTTTHSHPGSSLQGFSIQAGVQQAGALGSLAKFAESFAPELVEEIVEKLES